MNIIEMAKQAACHASGKVSATRWLRPKQLSRRVAVGSNDGLGMPVQT